MGKRDGARAWWAAALLAGGLLTTGATVASAKGGEPAGADSLDWLLDRVMRTGNMMGLQVSIVRGDRVAWHAERGYADREAGRRVTPATRFYIASTTKALTALAAAQRAARGELDLEAPLSRALPLAHFPDSVSGDSIRVVDLLTHTHGIDGDGPVSIRVAYTGDYTYADLYKALARHRRAATGRAFAYSNLGYDLAGIVLDPSRKGGWKDVVEREVTKPLGMNATTGYRSRVDETLIAQRYDSGADSLERGTLAKQDANMGPAGGLFSTAGDLGRLVVAELNAGRVDGRACIPAAVIASTQTQRTTQEGFYGFFHRGGWGLGWDLGTYDGDSVLHRFGGFPGASSHVSFMPARRLGVVVLANGGSAGMMTADLLAVSLYDRLLGRADATARFESRLAELSGKLAGFRARLAKNLAERAGRQKPLPRPLSAYAGTYVNPDWGTLELRLEGERLEARAGVARCPVEVFDATTEKLRVELFGGGDVIRAVFENGDANASAFEFKNVRFARR